MLRRSSPPSLLLATSLAVAAAHVAVQPACVIAGEGEGEGEGEGPAGGCSEPVEVPCRDQAFVALSMNLTTAAPGVVANTAAADGSFTVEVDARAGGFGGDQGFVYARFTDEGLVKVDLLDDASFDSMDWDIAFRRFVIRVNSGNAGPSCVTAARTGPTTDFSALAAVPPGLTFNAESFMSDATSCELVPDGSGLGSPGVVLQNWWEYPGCVATTGNVYVLSLADGRFVKLVVDQYYGGDGAQATCNDSGTSAGESGRIRLRYAFLD
jgi:hypothetical protein